MNEKVKSLDYSKYRYIVYIDESGDAAYNKITDETGHGASDYLNLAATIIQVNQREDILKYIESIQRKFGKKSILHMTSVCNHTQKVYLYKLFNKIPFEALAVISNKKTLSGEKYAKYNPEEPWKFYHHNLFYLFELLDYFIQKNKLKSQDMVFVLEESNSIRILPLRRYFSKIQIQNHKLLNICIDNIITLSKNTDKLQVLADVVAHSLYHITSGQWINATKIVEPRYFNEIKGKFLDINTNNSSRGIKFVHKIDDVMLLPEIRNIIKR